LFAALPQESPQESRWPQIAAQTEARHEARVNAKARAEARSKRRLWSALAAGLCAIALLPFAWRMSNRTETERAPVVAASAVAASAIDTSAMVASSPRIAIDAPAAVPDASTGSAPANTRAAIVPTAATSAHTRTARAQAAKSLADASSASTPAPGAEESIESLYTASAQLETLLTLTRDTRVESGPAAALAGGLDTELALIDARLAEPGLDPAEQRTLWRARVDTLRDASTFETHQRLLSAEGRRYEGALVSVD
jgi:hypothetical protein